jgi:hypothetical protein
MMHHDYQDIGEFVNIGVGIDSNIKDLANRVKSIVGYRGDPL